MQLIRPARKYLIALTLLGAAGALGLFRELIWSARYAALAKPKIEELAPTLPSCRGCNLIMVSLDTLRPDRLGFMNPDVRFTPRLDEIASRSAVFTSAFTNAYYTTPAHMTALTSLFPQRHRVESLHATSLAPDDATIAEILKKAGYRTAWFAPLNSRYLDRDQGFARGFDFFRESPFSRGGGLNPRGGNGFDGGPLRKFTDGGPRPFMIFLHSWITHSPFIWKNVDRPPDSLFPYARDLIPMLVQSLSENPDGVLNELARKENAEKLRAPVAGCLRIRRPEACLIETVGSDPFWHALGRLQSISVRRRLQGLAGASLQRETHIYRQAYDAAVEDLDRQVGQLWDELDRSGLLDDTIVVFFSDHGEELLERGLRGHSTFYENVARIPLFIYHPRLNPGWRSGAMVSLVDLMPTTLKLLEVPAPPGTQGRAPWEERVGYVYGSSLGADYIRDAEWKLMRDFRGEEKLYHLELDPEERVDLSGYRNPWVRSAHRRLSAERDSWILRQAFTD